MDGPYSRTRGKRSYSHHDREYTDYDDRHKRHMPDRHRPLPSPLPVSVPVDTVFRIVCPEAKAGSVIGKGGSIVKNLRHETGAKIMIADAILGSDERVILIADRDSSRDRDGNRDRGRDRHRDEGDNHRDPEKRDKNEWDTNGRGEFLSPSQEALMKIHSRIVEGGPLDGPDIKEEDPSETVTTRLLVPNSQVGCLLGKGGKIIQQMRDETKAHIRIVPRDQLPLCSLPDDEIVQIVGSIDAVKKALHIVSTRLYENPPRAHGHGHNSSSVHSPGHRTFPPEELFTPSRVPFGSLGSVEGHFRGVSPSRSDFEAGGASRFLRSSATDTSWQAPVFNGAGGDSGRSHDFESRVTDVRWPGPPFITTAGGKSGASHSSVSAIADEAWQAPNANNELVFRILCPNDKIGGLIGRGGSIIRSLQEDTGVKIKVMDPIVGSDERVVVISSVEHPDDNISPAQEALLHVQSRIADLGTDEDAVITSRLLVPSNQVGCLLGKGGSIISEMRRLTRANIRILGKGDLPKCALPTDELVQIVGDIRVAREALIQVTKRLRTNLYNERSLSNSGSSPRSQRYHERGSPARADFSDSNAGNMRAFSSSLQTSFSTPGQWPGKDILGGRFPEYDNPSLPQGSDLFRSTGALVTKTTVEVVIPSRAVPSIMGDGGAKIVQIRQMSGAKVNLLDVIPGASERIVEISGTPEQTHAAQSLLQAFILSGQSSSLGYGA